MSEAPALKVLLVCEDIPAPALGGLAKHVVALGNALIEAGHSVTLMGRDTPDYAAHADEAGFRGRFITGCGRPKGWKEKATGAWNPWKRPVMARTIARAIVAEAPRHDVIHYHGHLPGLARFLPAELPFVQTRHDQGSDCITHIRFRNGEPCDSLDPRDCARCIHPAPGALRTAVSAAAVRRYRADTEAAFNHHPVVFVSDFLMRNARRGLPGMAQADSRVLHNFIAESALPSRDAGSVDSGHPAGAPSPVRVHVAGRVEAAKGIVPLLDLLAPRLPAHWSIDVWGDGPDGVALRQRHGHQPRVRLHGHRPLAEVQRGCAQATVAVTPSLWEEPFGSVTLEALRLARPCYALHRGGTPELARYGAPGTLRLFDTLAELVDALLADEGRFTVAPGGESADVHARLPELLALYRGLAGRAAMALGRPLRRAA